MYKCINTQERWKCLAEWQWTTISTSAIIDKDDIRTLDVFIDELVQEVSDTVAILICHLLYLY